MSEIVLELTTHKESIRLRGRRFESVAVELPSFVDERALGRFYAHPSRANPSSFVNEFLAVSTAPRLTAHAIAALPDSDRARLRLAAMVMRKHKRRWRRLYGSHLSPDERFFAVMYWRWQENENVRAVIRRQHALSKEHRVHADALVHSVKADFGGIADTIKAMERLANLVTGPRTDVARFLSSPSIGASQMFAANAGVGANVARAMANPLGGVVDQLRAMPAIQDAMRVAETMSSWAAIGSSVVPRSIWARDAAAVVPAGSSKELLGWAGLKYELPTILGASPVGNWDRVFAAGDIGAGLKHLVADYSVLVPKVPEWGLGDQIGTWLEANAELLEAAEVVDRFHRRWQQRALNYLLAELLDVCGIWQMKELAELGEEQVEEAVLYMLEAVVSGAEFVPTLRSELKKAPYLNDTQRRHLDHMLRHAARGEWIDASAPLYPGLEGAFWQVGYVRAVVTTHRTDPQNTNKVIQFETMVRRLKLAANFQTLMVREIFGTAGNPHRHGDAESGERRQVLYGVAALAGWFEQFADVPALEFLVMLMSRALTASVEQARLTIPLPAA